MSAAMVSCSQHDEFLLGGEADGTEIVTSITLSTPEVFGSSRAVPSGVYAPEGEATTPINIYPGTSGMSSFGGVSFTKTRTEKDAQGNDVEITWVESISNVDLNEHPLTYTVGVYVATTTGEGEAATTTYTLVDKQASVKHTDAKATFNFHLLKGRPYKIVAYADYAEAEKENLEDIPVTFGLNDELKDAFFASQDFTASEQLNVVLRRPFGKLRLMASDFDTFTAGAKYKINKITVTYKTPRMLGSTKFNALDGTFDNENQQEKDVAMEAAPVAYALEYDADGKTDTAAVFTMYLPVNFTDNSTSTHGTLPDNYKEYIEGGDIPDSWMFPFDVTVNYEEAAASGEKNLTHTRSFAFDIPIKRNWLTTVHAGEFWTDNSNITVSIDHRFQGEIYSTPEENLITTADDLQAAFDKICQTGGVTHLKLGADICVDNKTTGKNNFQIDTYKYDVSKNVDIYLDLNGKTISAATGDPSGKSSGAVFSIENQLCVLHIDDSSKGANGKIEYTGEDNAGYPLICCIYGGQAVINGGSYISNSTCPVVYVYETEQYHSLAQRNAYKDLGIGANSTEPDATMKAKIRKEVEKYSSRVIINGGWFENAEPSTTAEEKKVCINSYNVRSNKWDQYKDNNAAYGEWAKWGEYPIVPNGKIKGITFGYVYLNGGSYVNFDPAKGDNMTPGGETDKSWQWGKMDNWVDNDKFVVLTSVVDGKTVYTVVPKKAPNKGDNGYKYPSSTL